MKHIVLKSISTAELVAELSKREGVDIDHVKAGWEYCIEKTPPTDDDPNEYDDDGDNPGMWTGLEDTGPCMILVIRE